jgi:tRNA-specific 2-thiouridylase
MNRKNGNQSKQRVAVAMSGGRDSSVAAALLLEQGYEVIGLTMRVLPDGSGSRSEGSVRDAARVAEFLGIPHVPVNLEGVFKEKVIDPFVRSYLEGLTPNPCAVCNRAIKFGALLSIARDLGCFGLATGHYARVEHGIRNILLRSRDKRKSQAYFLAMLSQDSLSSALFPLGDLTEEEVERLAAEMNLPLGGARSSQEICFVSGEGHAAFIAREIGRPPGPGPLLDREGAVLGEHEGYVRYTIGQRKGLGVAFGSPRYVIDIIPERNAVVIGDEEDLLSGGLWARDPNWIALERLSGPRKARVKIRYGADPVDALLEPAGTTRVRVRFDRPKAAVAPGQLVVFYDDDRVLGGAWIEGDLESSFRSPGPLDGLAPGHP